MSLLVAELLSSGCAAVGASSGLPTWNGLFKIGLVAPFEGQDGPRAAAFLDGMKMAQVEANGQGGVRGRRVELVALDDGNDPATARRRAQALAADPLVIAVAGHFTTESAASALPEYRQAGMALLSPATGEALAGPGFLRLGASDDQIGITALAYSRSALQADRITVVAEEVSASGGHGPALRVASVDLRSGQGLPALSPWNGGLAALGQRVGQDGPQALLFRGDAERVAMLLEALPPPRPAVVFLGDGYRLSRLARAGLAPLYYVMPLGPAPADLAARYQGSKEMMDWAAAGYRTVATVLDAAAGAGGQPDRASVEAGLPPRWSDGTVLRVYRLEGPNYPGQLQDWRP